MIRRRFNTDSQKGRYFLARGVLFAGISLSVILFIATYRWENVRRYDDFTFASIDRVNIIEDRFHDHIDMLYSIASFYASSQKVEREEFRTFAENILLLHPDILAIDWIPLVPEAERAVYEEAAVGYARFQINELDKEGKLVRAGRRSEYFPVYYVEPFEGNSMVFGFDVASDSERKAAMDKARDTAEPAMTAKIRLVRGGNEYGCRVFLPIYRNNTPHSTISERRQNLTGFSSVLFRIGETTEMALEKFSAAGVDIYLYDNDAPGADDRLLYYHNSRLSKGMARKQPPDKKAALSFTRDIKIGGRRWSFVCVAADEFLARHKIRIPWVSLASGLSLTFLLVVYLLTLAGRTATILKTVKERTEELTRAKEALEKGISERERMRQEAEKRNAQLEERTADLSRAQEESLNILEDLQQAKEELEMKNKELEKLDELKSEFVSTVSHELRTPLSITKEGISLVLDKISGEINEKQEKILTTARDNIDRLARIINDLLDISKIEAGRIELKRELIDIGELIKKSASLFEAKAKAKALELRLSLPAQGVYIYVDSDKMTQVFTNLLSNAIKFTHEGFIEIEVKDREGFIECSVADTGIGISQEDLPKTFGKFQQFNRTPGPGEKGTGLGLSIAKGIIEVHKGHIRAESAPGKGTKFIFSLPKYTSEMVFKEYISRSIREASKADVKMSLVSVSLVNFDKAKQEFSVEQARVILKELEGVLKNSLRRKGDIVVRDTGEAIVILVDCGKDNSLIVEGRLEQALESYLADKGLSQKIQLRLASVTYPDEAKSGEEMVNRIKRG